jgi:hypothetical protein
MPLTFRKPSGAAWLALGLIGCSWASGIRAAASDAVEIYRRIPDDVADVAFTTRVKPNAEGLVVNNDNGWLEVALQRGAMVPIQWAAITGDQTMLNTNWSAAETAFAHQRSDGGFVYAPVIDGKVRQPIGEPTSDAFFISEVSNACLLLQEGPLAGASRPIVDAARPKIQDAVEFLARPSSLSAMRTVDAPATNRLAYDSKALILGGQLTQDDNAKQAGANLLAHVLALQTVEGIFPENGGGDSSYQSVTLLKLTELAILMPEYRAKLDRPLRRGFAWELARIGSDGEVTVEGNTRTGLGQEHYFGKPKAVNYPEVIRALALFGALERDSAVLDTAHQVAAYYVGQHG